MSEPTVCIECANHHVRSVEFPGGDGRHYDLCKAPEDAQDTWHGCVAANRTVPPSHVTGANARLSLTHEVCQNINTDGKCPRFTEKE